MTTKIRMTEARALYTVGNNAGRGYAPDQDTIDATVEALVEEGGTLVLDRNTSDDVAVVEDSSGELIAIGGDAGGRNAWAVVILSDEQILALREEAIAAGDDLQASLCNSAIRGNADHRLACAVAMANAAAQQD